MNDNQAQLGERNPPSELPELPGIKNDNWIRSQCIGKDKPMIEPFEPQQVRYVERNANLAESMQLKELMENGDSPEEAAQHLGVYGVRHDVLLGFQIREKVISYGTSSFGYDVRVADEFKVFTNINSTMVDPKNFDPKAFVDVKGPRCIIPPNGFALARTMERMRIPRDVMTICLGKSTYARCGIIVNVTPFEPEWEGYVTLEFSNTTPLPAVIYAGEGCAQVLFFQGTAPEKSYKDRGGKYQGQEGVVLPRT